MRDHVTDELISAYVDGELKGDELKLVEDLLAKSSEHRQLLAEFRSLRASMWSLPNFNLPDDFHSRIVREIDELAKNPSKEPAQPARRASKARPWRSVLFAAASLAAVVAATLMLHPPAPTIPGAQSIDPLRVVPVYLQQAPKYVMVYDVTVTSAGQKSGVIEKLLKNLGIGIDPALRLDEELEAQLLAIRESPQIPGATEVIPYKKDPATPKSTANDKVEMIYVAGKLNTLSEFGIDLSELRKVGEEVSQLRYGMAIETNKLGVMHRLHDSATEHFAHSTTLVPADSGYAFRLAFRIELKSVSIPGAAAFPIPTLNTFDKQDAVPQPPVGHILLIIRNVDAKK